MARTSISRRTAMLSVLAALPVLPLAQVPSSPSPYKTAPGYSAQDYVTGLPEASSGHWGPIGLAFDQSDNLYVADVADDNIYRFQPGGGAASAATRITPAPIPGISGLAISRGGDLYAARYGEGDVVQVDADTGLVLRRVATVPCPMAIAIDPISGDLFVSQDQCGSTIYRISDYASHLGTVTAYASAPEVDGLTFDQGGSLYAESAWHVLKLTGTNTSSPGTTEQMASVPKADGIAFGAHRSREPTFLVTNDNDGTVTRVDLDSGIESTIFSGGSRGDFAAVDSRGCLYITQSASIVRIGGSGQGCAFEPTTVGSPLPPGVVLATQSLRHRVCVALRSLTLRLRQRGRVRLSYAYVFVNGRLRKLVKGRAVEAPIVLRGLPRSAFTVKTVALTTTGRKLVASHRYLNCTKPVKPKHTTRNGKHRH